MKLETTTDPQLPGWVFAEYKPGQRVTKDMVSFDTIRPDVHVNKYGVVLFYDIITARRLLEKYFKVEL